MFKPTQTERCIYTSVLFHFPITHLRTISSRRARTGSLGGRRCEQRSPADKSSSSRECSKRRNTSTPGKEAILAGLIPVGSSSATSLLSLSLLFSSFLHFRILLSRFSLLLIFSSSCIYAICIPPQASGGVRAASEDLVPEPSDEVEEAGERGGAAQDGGQQQLDQQQRAWKAGGGLHDQGRISLQRTEQVLEAQRAKGHHNAGA